MINDYKLENYLEPKGLKLMLVWDKLPSVNKMYVRTRTGMTLSNEVRSFKTNISKQTKSQLPKRLPFERNDVFKISIQFILKDRFFMRDTDNMLKMLIDAIFEELGINDSRVVEIDAKKSFRKASRNEYIKVTIEKSEFDYEFFNKEDIDYDIPKEEVQSLTEELRVELINNLPKEDKPKRRKKNA